MSRRWTHEELAYLKEHYYTQPAKITAVHLDRSLRAVYLQAFKLFKHPYEHISIELPMLNLPPITAAYLAGFIDADGYIGGSVRWRDGYPAMFVGQITISCADKDTVDWLAKSAFRNRWNKSYIISHTEDRYRITRQHYYANVSHRPHIIPLLKTVLPYLRLKKCRAELLLQFYRQHTPRTPYALSDWQLILALYEDIASNHPKAIKARKRLADYITSQEGRFKHEY